MVLLINALLVEVYSPIHLPGGPFYNAIKIYDPLEIVAEKQERVIIQYLYDEGFILDRRINCDIITGEDCNG